MFLPRRRWDTLIEAYLEEFKGNENAELYLKVNYPSWHPVPGKPRQDLLNLVESLRRKTGSEAAITIDDDLGTRIGIVHLIDSCNVYVSTDTAHTASVGEAVLRQRLTIFPAGLGLELPGSCYVPIPAGPAATIPLSPEMLLYQPYHKETTMPRLNVNDVRAPCAVHMICLRKNGVHVGLLRHPSCTLRPGRARGHECDRGRVENKAEMEAINAGREDNLGRHSARQPFAGAYKQGIMPPVDRLRL